ncbi:SARP family transcriptional regulator [Longispora fulva]|uniref:DNA-binding CsgD family transcriptional regulator n=1 Tax=Longispora fulva TaxID=619741 RepID=A0A8J7G9W5_9ACTN|nr:LuxR family transcriptional regulator [Longispora fulva]MBG6134394.1 DNA-binding CsgD family transcriptional regulator [Longispora fulva]GIG62689.1 SARP family transcriptional regulator [Longispora fulva]
MAGSPGPRTLVGRGPQRQRLHDLLSGLTGGRGGVLWVEGEPGIGKSALLAALTTEAAERGVTVRRGLAEELAGQSPLRVMLDCLDPRRTLDPEPDRALLPADPVFARIELLVGEAERLCGAGPVLVVVDDLQWADDASLLVCDRLAQLTGQYPLLVALGSRPAPGRPRIARTRLVLAGRGAEVMTLPRLTGPEVERLAGWLLGDTPDRALLDWIAGAGGNPCYVREMVGAHRRGSDRVPPDRPDPGQVGDLAPPVGLTAMITDRLSHLSDEARTLLRVAAVLGVEFSVAELSTVTGQPPSRMIPAVEEAVAHGVLVERGPALGFGHGLIRQVLYQGLPAGLRAALHRQSAELLDHAGGPVTRVAEHLLAAGGTGDHWAVGWLGRSAGALSRQAPHLAVELLGRYLDDEATGHSVRGEFEVELAMAMFRIDRYDEVDRLARQAAPGTTDPARRARLVWTWSYALLRLGRTEEALRTAEDGAAHAARDPAWRARLAGFRALALVSAGRFDEGESEAHAVLAEDLVDPLAAGYALHTLSWLPSHWRVPALALADIDSALARVRAEPAGRDLRVLLLGNRTSALGGLDRLAEADVSVAEMLTAADALGVPMRVTMSRLTAAEHWFRRGRWDDAAAELELLEESQLDQLVAWRLRGRGLAALLAVHRDDRPAVVRHLAAVAEPDISAGDAARSQCFLRMARAEHAERDRDPSAAMAELVLLLDLARDERHDQESWLPHLTRLALTRGDAATARRTVLEAGDRADTSTERAARDWCSGLLDDDPALILAASEALGTVGRPHLWARAREDAAVALAARGDQRAARLPYEEALSGYRDLGSVWDLRRADSRLRAHGVRRGPRGARGRPATGWESLTPAELRVAALVGEGLTNHDIAEALFLSKRTVETHMSHILAKLAVRTRIEIAREAARHEPGGGEWRGPATPLSALNS